VGILAISERQVSLGDKISPFFAEALPNGALIRNFIFQARFSRATARVCASGQRAQAEYPAQRFFLLFFQVVSLEYVCVSSTMGHGGDYAADCRHRLTAGRR
jgi:hypothetical protein